MGIPDKAIASPEIPPPPLAGIGVAAVVVTAIIGWIVLGGHFLSETALFGGLMMLWYWAKVEHLSMKRLPASIIGALVGIGVAWVIFYGATQYGSTGLLIGLAVLIIAIYLDVVQIFPQVVNAATMLYSIVAAAPLVQFKIDWIQLCFATAGGGLFFGLYVAAVMWLAGKRAPGRA